jgi:hypothetical protein
VLSSNVLHQYQHLSSEGQSVFGRLVGQQFRRKITYTTRGAQRQRSSKAGEVATMRKAPAPNQREEVDKSEWPYVAVAGGSSAKATNADVAAAAHGGTKLRAGVRGGSASTGAPASGAHFLFEG